MAAKCNIVDKLAC